MKTKAVDSNISKIIDVLQEAMELLQVLKIILNQSVQGLTIWDMLGYSSALIKLLSKGIPEDNLHKHGILLKPKAQ